MKLIAGLATLACLLAALTPRAAHAATATFGKTSVGASTDTFSSERKRVNRYALPEAGSVTKLTVYLAPTSTSGQEVLRGLLYSDNAGKPEALLGSSEQLTFKSTNAAGWYDLAFATPVKLAAGNYWIGLMSGATGGVASWRYDNVTASRAWNANSYASGPSNPFGAASTDAEQASLYATYTSEASQGVPQNTSPPAISGRAEQGQTLTASTGAWTGSPGSYAYQWLRCDTQGAGCAKITLATTATYKLVEADVGHTLRVEVTASNGAGSSAPATSAQTPAVSASGATEVPHKVAPPAISGNALVGATLTASTGAWTGSPTSYAYQWKRCNELGKNCHRITGATASKYVASERDAKQTLRVAVSASNTFGTSRPALSAPTQVIAGGQQPPQSTAPPTISGTAQDGQTLSHRDASWSGEPSAENDHWLRCDSTGNECKRITGAAEDTYVPNEADVGHRLRIEETATNAAGTSAPVESTPTAVVTEAGATISHLEYVLQDSTTSVYDMDNGFKLIKTISMPADADEVRGVSVAPSRHLMYVMHGGDGPINGSGNGSVLAWDLVGEKAAWDVKLNSGIDSGQASPDGAKIYVPTGENTESGIWNVLSAANGQLLETIQGGSGAHNTVVSNDGRFVYLGGRLSSTLSVYETQTAKTKQIGPLVGTVRPLTANGSNTLVFTTATNFDGFQVSSVSSAKVLFTVSFGEVPAGFRFTAPSHGISLSPDERQLYVIDAVHKVVQFYDVSKLKEGIAPSPIATVALAGLGSGSESGCRYDCGYGGWLQLSRDGRYLFVGDSGEVIDTSTRKVITTLSTLAQTKKSIEVDWQGGVPIATSGRTGVGMVE